MARGSRRRDLTSIRPCRAAARRNRFSRTSLLIPQSKPESILECVPEGVSLTPNRALPCPTCRPQQRTWPRHRRGARRLGRDELIAQPAAPVPARPPPRRAAEACPSPGHRGPGGCRSRQSATTAWSRCPCDWISCVAAATSLVRALAAIPVNEAGDDHERGNDDQDRRDVQRNRPVFQRKIPDVVVHSLPL